MNVHKLGEGQILPGESNDDLIEAIESLLERAKTGEIKALAWAGLTGNDHVITGWDGPAGTCFTMAAPILTLHSRYGAYLQEDG